MHQKLLDFGLFAPIIRIVMQCNIPDNGAIAIKAARFKSTSTFKT